jgi:hypothetical protein
MNFRRDCFQAITGQLELPSGDERAWSDDQKRAWRAVQLLEAYDAVLPTPATYKRGVTRTRPQPGIQEISRIFLTVAPDYIRGAP